MSNFTRRQATRLVGALAGCAALPVAEALASPKSRTEKIQEHLAAILALLRAETPGSNGGRILFSAGEEQDANGSLQLFLNAGHLDTVWEIDTRLKRGGLMTEKVTHHWHLKTDGTSLRRPAENG